MRYSYLYLCQSYKEKGKVKQRVIQYLGKAEGYEPFNPSGLFLKEKNCKNCSSTEKLTLDHIMPTTKGGKNNPENLQVLCMRCNTRKGKR